MKQYDEHNWAQSLWMCHWITDLTNSLQNFESFKNETPLYFAMICNHADLFETIFGGKIVQKQSKLICLKTVR